MALYLFEASDGSTVEISAPMTNPPKMGSVRRIGGKRYRRVLTRQFQTLVQRDIAHVSRCLPPRVPGARAYVEDPSSPLFGQPIVTTKADVANIEAATHGQYKYDPGIDNPEKPGFLLPKTGDYDPQTRWYPGELTGAKSG